MLVMKGVQGNQDIDKNFYIMLREFYVFCYINWLNFNWNKNTVTYQASHPHVAHLI